MPGIIHGGTARGAAPLRIFQSILGITVSGVLFWFLAHELMSHVDSNPKLVAAFPFLGLLALITTMPFIFYIAFSTEFSHLKPLDVKDYIYLMKSVFRACAAKNSSSGKVTAKDL